MVPVSADELATIHSRGGFRYALTLNDVLWAARMAVYEGGESPGDVLWTVTQRMVWFAEEQRTSFSSFASLAQAFSQPINPKWRRDGEFCLPGGKYHGKDNCAESRLRRRDEAASATWTQLADKDERAAEETALWSMAALANPVPRATNFSVPSVAKSYVARTPGAEILFSAGNTFISEPGTENWPSDYVYMQTPSGRVASADSGFVGGSGSNLLKALYRGMTEWWRFA